MALAVFLWRPGPAQAVVVSSRSIGAAPSAPTPAAAGVGPVEALDRSIVETPGPRSSRAALVVRIQDSTGAPVAGATTEIVTDDCLLQPAEVRSAEASHLFSSVEVARLLPWNPLLVVSAPGLTHEPQCVTIAEGQIVITMVAETSIEGVVRGVDGGAPLGPVDVVAVAEEVYGGVVARRLFENNRLPRARCDGDGRFVLRGLKARTNYYVAAGGNGQCPFQWVPCHLGTTAAPLLLDLRWVFGCGVTLIGSDEQKIPDSSFLRVKRRPGESDPVQFLSADSIDAGLAGISQVIEQAKRVCGPTRVYLGSSNSSRPFLEIVHEWDAPGIPTAMSDLRFERVSADHIAIHVVKVGSPRLGFGDVDVGFSSPVIGGPKPQIVGLGWLVLELTPVTSGVETSIRRQIPTVHAGDIRLKCVPAGAYRLRLLRSMGSEEEVLAESSIEVSRSGLSKATLAVGPSGSILLLPGHKGRPYRRYLRVTLRDNDGKMVQTILARPPYRIDGLRPGAYRLELAGQFPQNEASEDNVFCVLSGITVDPAATNEVACELAAK
jgi:hypothetical protein